MGLRSVWLRKCLFITLHGQHRLTAFFISLFSQSQPGSSLGVSRRRIMKMDEVVRVVVKSSKSPISAGGISLCLIRRGEDC